MRPTLAKPLITSGRRRLNISSGLKTELEILENSLETATAAPIGKDDSIKVMSWLKRFRIEPVSVAEKNVCGALQELLLVVWNFNGTQRVEESELSYLMTVLRRM